MLIFKLCDFLTGNTVRDTRHHSATRFGNSSVTLFAKESAGGTLRQWPSLFNIARQFLIHALLY
jgi:hypothetical protein